jgi:hypothetical protein
MYKIISFLVISLISTGLFSQKNAAFEYAYEHKGQVIASTAPRGEGLLYRIHLIDVRHYNPRDPDLQSLHKYGTIYPDRLLQKGIIQLILGDWKSRGEAAGVLQKVQRMGFSNALIIPYRDGYREE